MNNRKYQEYRTAGKLYFQQGVSIPLKSWKDEAPPVMGVPAWIERLAAWIDRFISLCP